MPSTDAASSKGSLFGAIAGFGDWLSTRLKNIDIFDEHHHNEAKTNPFYTLGGIFYLVWFIVIASGCLLIMWYVPTKAGAFDSILRIQHEMPLGNIARGMHKYGADAMIIAATMRMYRMFICADYKPGKEFNIAIALVTLLLSMYSGLTGYLLIWNQRAFWATKVFATFPTYMDQFPIMGDYWLPIVKSVHMGWNTAEFLLGAGGAITQETITRFFSLHLAFSAIPLILVELYFYKTGFKRMPINWTKRAVVIAMLVIVSIIMPAALGHRSNPDVTPLPILSDWYFLGLYQMYKYLEPVVATEITMVIPLSVVLLPFMDVWITGQEKDITKRPLIFYTAIMGFVCWIVFSLLIIVNIANIHTDPPWWRAFLWGLVDVGVLLQLLVFVQHYKTVQEKAQAARGAIVMGIYAAQQCFWAVIFYYMALTELFLSRLTQGWTYWACKLMGFLPGADKAEECVRLALKGNNLKENASFNPSYWDYHNLMANAEKVPVQDNVKTLYETVTTSHGGLDWLFGLIPSFTVVVEKNVPKAVPYQSALDFMVCNRWCDDYLAYIDRMGMTVGGYLKEPLKSPEGFTYPLSVPVMDWVWMIVSFVTLAACVVVYFMMKAPAAPAAPPAEPK